MGDGISARIAAAARAFASPGLALGRSLIVSLLCLLASLGAGLAPAAAGEATVSIHLIERGRDVWRIVYDLPRPTARLDLGPHLNGYRQAAWRVLNDDAAIVFEDGRDILVVKGGARFQSATIDMLVRPVRMARTYEAVMPMGDAGALLYTGHFQPWSDDGRRLRSVISVEPRRGRYVTAFETITRRLENWTSPLDHPAFIFVGRRPQIVEPGAPTAISGKTHQVGAYVGMVDPAAPDWVRKEVETIAAATLRTLETAFGWTLDATPNFFVSYGGGLIEGRAAFTGDALPGQFRVALEGGAWDAREPFALNILRAGIAHEAAHLWQAAARPSGLEAPDWIHEGGANAIAAEIMIALGYWTPADAARDMAEARRACAEALRGRALDHLRSDHDMNAVYYCGQVLNVLAAQAHPGGAIGFWNDFIDRARVEGGYDAALFYRLAGETGGPALSKEMARFARTNYARPERGFAALDAAAAAAPYQGRVLGGSLQSSASGR